MSPSLRVLCLYLRVKKHFPGKRPPEGAVRAAVPRGGRARPRGAELPFRGAAPSLGRRGATWRRRCCCFWRCCWNRRPPCGRSPKPSAPRRAAAAARWLLAGSASARPPAPPWGRAAPCWRRLSSGTGRCCSPPPARPVRRRGGSGGAEPFASASCFKANHKPQPSSVLGGSNHSVMCGVVLPSARLPPARWGGRGLWLPEPRAALGSCVEGDAGCKINPIWHCSSHLTFLSSSEALAVETLLPPSRFLSSPDGVSALALLPFLVTAAAVAPASLLSARLGSSAAPGVQREASS